MIKSAIDLQSYIRDRTKNITKDCRTLLFFKQEYNGEYHAHEDILGGGNLLIATGLFAALEYLSKIYYVLKVGYENIPNSDKPAPTRRPHEIHLEKPLFELIGDYPINFGLQTLGRPRLKKFWHKWRNKLAHLLAQDPRWGAVEAFDDLGLNFQNTETYIENNFISFSRNNGRWICNADKFRMDIDEISEWTCNQMNNYSGERIRSTLNWLKRCWK